MESRNESKINEYPDVIPYASILKIIEQMEKNICKIDSGNGQGTGFFCKIPFPDLNNIIPVFITNNHVIDQNILNSKDKKISIYIKGEKDKKLIELDDRMKYTNKDYDITIIEIKEQDNLKNFLELDDIIINDIIHDNNLNIEYEKETLYVIQYPKGKLSVSYGILQNIFEDKRYEFQHKCCTDIGSSGSPILNLNNKIIGIHKQGCDKYNIGTFLNEPIKEFIRENYNKMLIKKFNKKYRIDIKDIQINELNLCSKNFGNEALIDLCKIKFNELKNLNLSKNSISDIKILEKAKLENLIKLDLSFNKISDINVLAKINFRELKILNLSNNDISDINVLDKIKIAKLETLDFTHNKISDINILEKVNMKELKKLDLYFNKITKFEVLKKLKFLKSEIIHLEKITTSDNNKNVIITNNEANMNMKNMNMMNLMNNFDMMNYNMNMMNNINMMKNNMNMMNRMNMTNKMYMMNMMNGMNTIDDIRAKSRLEKEFSLCSKDDELKHIGCTFQLENNNYFIWRVSMMGAKDSPYEGGIFTIRIKFPPDYPKHGPDFRFLNRIYHLHVYIDHDPIGRIANNYINEWMTCGSVMDKPIYGVKQALFDIFCSFYYQLPTDCCPLSMEYEYRDNYNEFSKKAKEWTRKYAIKKLFI